ncbi:hypothetical protein IWZ01DRAFT_480485 [Phyllosticta capitalensis]
MRLFNEQSLRHPAFRRFLASQLCIPNHESKGAGEDWREAAAAEAWTSAKFFRNRTGPKFPRIPMRPGNLDIRFSDWENEDRVAAYLNFTDRAAFHDFLLSFPVLEAYIVWHEHTDCLPRARQALTLLANNIYMFPLSLESIVEGFGRKHDPTASKRKSKSKESLICREDLLLAAVLNHLVECTSPLLERTSLHHKLEFQSTASEKFKDTIGLEIPEPHDISLADATFWGKRMYTVEHPIETYNRAFVLLNHLHHLIAHKQWNSHWDSSDAFATQKIPFEAYPAWMKRTDGDASHLLWR